MMFAFIPAASGCFSGDFIALLSLCARILRMKKTGCRNICYDSHSLLVSIYFNCRMSFVTPCAFALCRWQVREESMIPDAIYERSHRSCSIFWLQTKLYVISEFIRLMIRRPGAASGDRRFPSSSSSSVNTGIKTSRNAVFVAIHPTTCRTPLKKWL